MCGSEKIAKVDTKWHVQNIKENLFKQLQSLGEKIPLSG